MRHPIAHFAAALSILLTLALWLLAVRSLTTVDHVGSRKGYTDVSAFSALGEVTFIWDTFQQPVPRQLYHGGGDARRSSRVETAAAEPRFLGVRSLYSHTTMPGLISTLRALVVPYWMLIVIAAIPALTWLVLLPRRRRRFVSRCRRCGYDLRATTTGTCPECGALNPLPPNVFRANLPASQK